MKADSSTVRIINQKSILETIYENDGISKADLALRLNMSKPSVSRNVADLISMGIVREHGEGESTKSGGRKPTKLRFDEDYCYIAAVELSSKQPICAIGDLKSNVLRLVKLGLDKNDSSEVKLAGVYEAIRGMLAELSISEDDLGLIIVSQPGQISEDSKIAYVDTFHHQWTNIGLREHLQKKFNTTVVLRNDVQMAAIGEMNFGSAKQFESLIFVSCGVGLGSSIIYKGKLFQGDNHASGELGAFLVADGRRLGQVVSMDGLLEHISEINKEMDFDEVVEKSIADDALINQALRDIGRTLGQAIYNCCIMMDISTVVFGGDYARLGSALFESIEETLNQTFLPSKIALHKSALQEAAGIFGSLVIAKDIILKNLIEL